MAREPSAMPDPPIIPDPIVPGRDCPLCPRLVAFRQDLRAKFALWHNAPVPSFGPSDAALLIVGLAPGLKGANRTGRPFTGDYAGDLLYATLARFGWASGKYLAGRDDGAWAPDTLALKGVRITNAVRCLPPENKPVPKEIATCRPFLVSEIAALTRLKAVLALGRVAHESVLATLQLKPSGYKFAHGAMHTLPDGLVLADSYHCSRYNTNTGRLTAEMFEAVFEKLRTIAPLA
jgi:uracil-DNA glycosylase